MGFVTNEYSNELKEILEKRFSINNQLERYKNRFSDKIKQYQDIFTCTEQETAISLYISDYLLTSSEIIGLGDEDRIKGLFESMIIARDEVELDFLTQLTLIELSQQLISAIRRHLLYQRDRGFPLDVVKTQIIDSWLRDLFNMLSSFKPIVDIRWIIAELEGAYKKQYSGPIYSEIVADFSFRELIPANYYIAGEYLVNRLNFSFKSKDYITKTPYNLQIDGTDAILIFFSKNGKWIGSTSTIISNKPELQLHLESIQNIIPSTTSENGEVDLRYFQVLMNKLPNITQKRIFYCIELLKGNTVILIIKSTKLEDINYTSVREMLRQYIMDSACFSQKDDLQINNLLTLWAKRFVISQTVEGAEVFGLLNDVDREREWVVDSFLKSYNSSSGENVEIYARDKSHDQLALVINNLLKLTEFTHELTEFEMKNIDYPYEIIPYEAFFEGNNFEDALIFLVHQDNEHFGLIKLQAIFKVSDQYVNRKRTITKRKFTRLKVRELARSKDLDYEHWLTSNFEFKQFGYEYSLENLTINLKEKHAGKEPEIEIKEISYSVDNRLQELENKKNLSLEIQNNIFNFMTEILHSHMKIEIINNNKLSGYFDYNFKNKINKEEKVKIEQLIDEFNIHKLPNLLGNKILEVVDTIDAYFFRELREGLFKLQEIEKSFIRMEVADLEMILKIIKENQLSSS